MAGVTRALLALTVASCVGRKDVSNNPDPDAAVDGPPIVESCTPGEWTLETVDAEGDLQFGTSIALDGDGTPHVVYFRSDQTLHHAVRGGAGSWATAQVEPGGFYARLLTDATGTMHLVHYTMSPDALRYGRWDGAAWQLETVAAKTAFDLGFGVGSDGRIHIAMFGLPTTGGNPEYVVGIPGTWDPPISIASTMNGPGSDLAVDANNTVHAIWAGGGGVAYSTGSISSLFTTPEVAATDSAVYARVATGTVPHIVFRRDAVNGGSVVHASRDDEDSGWTETVVDASGDAGENVAIAVDASDAVHVAYTNQDENSLRYAHRPAGALSFDVETADPGGSIGQGFIEMVVDDQGGVHISYIDFGAADVKYAFLCP